MTIEEAVEYEKCSITNERAIEILSRVTLAYEVGKVTVTQAEIQKALDMAIKALEQTKTGEWVEMKIDNPNSIFDGCVKDRRCSVCDYHSATRTKYCSNCGAKMEVEE